MKSSSSGEYPLSSNSDESALTPNEIETISPKTPVSDTVPTEPQSISGVLTDEPTSADPTHEEEQTHHHVASADDTLPEVSADGPLPTDRSITESLPSETTTAPSALDAPIAPDHEDGSAEADIEIPNSISETAPITISSPQKSPEISNGHVASSIDEAIADFQTALKTPEPESIKAPETLSATEVDATSGPAVTSETHAPAIAEEDRETSPTVNGPKSTSKVNGKEELSATAPRSVSASPAPPVKDVGADVHSEGEGATMEDIEID